LVNLRGDIAAAVAASGMQPMLKTSEVKPDEDWEQLLDSAKTGGSVTDYRA
jgi:hypothetical protein